MGKLTLFYKIILNELKKELYTAWSYKGQWLGEFTSLIAFFFFLNAMTNHSMVTGSTYCFWFYSILIMGDISGKVSMEMHMGTFEQIYLSPIPISILFISKAITAILKSFIIMSMLLFFLSLLGYVNLSFFHQQTFLALLVITPGLFGISLFLGGLVMLLKNIGWIINIFNNSFLFLSGIFLSVDSLPNALQIISKLLPISQAVQILNGFADLEYLLKIVTLNTFYFCIGLYFFYLCEKVAKKKGLLGYY